LKTNNSLTKRIWINSAAFGYAQLVTIAIQFALIPFFIHSWGIDLYGEWIVVTSVPALLSFLDFGVAQASSSKAIMCAGANDLAGVRRSLQTALMFSMAIGATLVGLALVVHNAVEWQLVLKLKLISGRDAGLILLMFCANLTIQLIGGVVDGWFRAIDRVALGTFLLANRRLLDLITSIALLYL
jgi:hypothetical protein